MKDARTFFHNRAFTSVREVVEYFNAGTLQDPTAGAAPSLSDRFTQHRGPGTPRGLGLTPQQVTDLTNFIENGLYEPSFLTYDRRSSTDTFQPNVHDLTYSKYRPDLAALGAKDSSMPSGPAIDDNDALARRDEGLEFLDATRQCAIVPLDGNDSYRITNSSSAAIDTNLLVVVSDRPHDARQLKADGTTSNGDPYLRLFLKSGTLDPNTSVVVRMHFADEYGQPHYKLTLLSEQGKQVTNPQSMVVRHRRTRVDSSDV